MAENGSDEGPAPTAGSRPAAMAGMPPISFSEFAMSVGMNAMAMLDDEGDLVPSKADLPQAAQHIDILRMLRTKTHGNLDEDEARLLETLIHDLQMRYLEAARRR